jgi:hypothetical protein
MRYERHLRVSLDTRPIVVIAQDEQGRDFQGDVTPGPFVSLRFHGSSGEQAGDAVAGQFTRFIAHEVFHFWNGSLTRARDETTPSWLAEGGADYAALLMRSEKGELDDAGMRSELSVALTRCWRALEDEGDVGMNELKFLSQNVRYPCGMVIQWAGAIEASIAGRGGFYESWSRLIGSARQRTGSEYELSDYYRSVGRADGKPFLVARLLTEERGSERWVALKSALEALGAVIDRAPTADTRRDRLVFHLLAQVCSAGSRGFSLDPGRLTLQMVATCAPLADNSVLTSVEGGDILAPDEATYAAVQDRCRARSEIHVVVDGDHPLAIPCRESLGPPRDAFIVRKRPMITN